MRAMEIIEPGGPEVVRFAERDEPAPGPGQVTIRVEYAGLNFVDVLARRGVPGYFTGWPFVPGMEVGGTIHALGEGVDAFAAGDRVVAFTVDGTGLADVAVARVGLTVPVPADLDLATATTIPLTWATAFGLVRVSHADAGDTVLVTAASGGVGSAIGQLLARQGAARVIGGVRSPAQAATLAAAYTPVTQGEGFVARALQTAGVPGFDVVLESVGGSVLASVLGGLAVGGRVVSYGAAAGEPDPAPPPVPDLRTQNLTITGFSILNRARKAPPKALSLIRGVLALTQGGLRIPHRPSWTGPRRSMRTSHKAKDAAAEKQSYVCNTLTGHGKAHQPPLPDSPVCAFPVMLLAGAADGQARRPACSSVSASPCRQFRARATRPRTTSGGSPGVLAICHSVGSSCSACPRSGEPTLGSPPASIRRHEPGAQPSRFSTIPRVLGETRWPFSSFPSVRSVTPVASAKARLSRMPSSTRRAMT
jgi:NADPH:quinone reductase